MWLIWPQQPASFESGSTSVRSRPEEPGRGNSPESEPTRRVRDPLRCRPSARDHQLDRYGEHDSDDFLCAYDSALRDRRRRRGGRRRGADSAVPPVEPGELKDIDGTGVYRSALGGTEGKHFFPTKSQAENFSKMVERTGKGPYYITSGCIPTSTLRGIETIHPASEGTAYFIPEDLLPYFSNIIIHGP